MDDLNKVHGGIQSIDYISQILELFCEQSESMSLKEIASALEDNPAKIFRYLVSLTRIGLLHKTDKNEYEIGHLALDLSFKALNVLDPLEEVCRVAKQINQERKCGVVISVWGTMGPTVIKTYEEKESLYSRLNIGTVMSLRETSIGNTFAKYFPEHILKVTLEHEHLRYLGHKLSVKERNDFIYTIKKVPKYDITFKLDCPIKGYSSISIPVVNISNDIEYVFTIFQRSHVFGEFQHELEQYLLGEIDVLTRMIGFR